jgi:hypothetical protein
VEAGEFDEKSTSFLFQTSHGGNIPETWILLDNHSTVDVSKLKSLLKVTATTSKTMTIHCNAGKAVTNQVGELADRIWYCLVPPIRYFKHQVPCMCSRKRF